jgi:hypothetical protein
LSERGLGSEAEIDRLRQAGRGVLNIETGAEGKAIIAPGEGGLNIDRSQLRAERGVPPDPVWLVIGFQSEGREDSHANGDISVLAVAQEWLRQIHVAEDVIHAGVSAITAENWLLIERRARQPVTGAVIREFIRRNNGVESHLEFAVVEPGQTRRVEEQGGDIFGAGGPAGESGAEAATLCSLVGNCQRERRAEEWE